MPGAVLPCKGGASSRPAAGRSPPACAPPAGASPGALASRCPPPSTQVADIIADTADIPREEIKPESHAIDDLGIDSLAFLDIAFAIDKAFGIKLPLEQWTQEVNEGKAPAEEYFVMKNLVTRIDRARGLPRTRPDRAA